MDNLRITKGVSNIFVNFFRNKNSRKDDYLAYKTLIYQQIYDMMTGTNCKTPEDAFRTMNQILGLKCGLEQIKIQYEVAKKITEKK